MSNERSPRASCWTTMGTSGICNLQVAGCTQRSACATMWLLMTVVRREVVLPVDPDRAWELITDPAELEGWLADDVELEPEEGGEGCEEVVEEVDEGRRLVFVWGEEPSRVVWTLDPVPEGTRFVVTERSLAPVVGPRMAALSARASLCLA